MTDQRHGGNSRRAELGLGARARTESVKDMARAAREESHVRLRVVDEVDAERPRTRGDCVNDERPCPFVSCAHHLFLDVDPGTGSVKFNFPELAPEDMDPGQSCALDVADLGGMILADVGVVMNMTRERVRQIEDKGLRRIRRTGAFHGTSARELREYADDGAEAPQYMRSLGSVWKTAAEPEEEPAESAVVSREVPSSISFFAESERADEFVCDSVWRMLTRGEGSEEEGNGNE